MMSSESYKDTIIENLRKRIDELISEKNDLIHEANNLDREVNRLKKVCLNISTEMTASKMSKWSLTDPEQLFEIEGGIEERKLLRDEIDRKEDVIIKLQKKNNKLHDKLREELGYTKMMREVLKKNTMVIHPEVSKECRDKACITDSISFDKHYKVIDDCGGFGMFEASPPQSPKKKEYINI